MAADLFPAYSELVQSEKLDETVGGDDDRREDEVEQVSQQRDSLLRPRHQQLRRQRVQREHQSGVDVDAQHTAEEEGSGNRGGGEGGGGGGGGD